MHIVFMTLDFSSRTSGGIGTYIRTMAKGLSERGHLVTVVSSQISQSETAAYRVVRIDSNSVQRESRRIELSGRFLSALREIHESHPIDLAEATDWGMEGYACSRAKAFPSIVRFHTPNSLVEQLNGEARFADSALVNSLETDYFEQATALSSPSKTMAEYLKKKGYPYTGRITIIPNLIDISEYSDCIDREETGSGRFVLGFFGRIEVRKGGRIFAEALTELFPRHPQLMVDFIGPNTRIAGQVLAKEIQSRLEPYRARIRFLGHVVGEDKRAAIGRCNAVVCPSPWENFPYACLEAQACGKTVIAFRGSGFDEMIDHEDNGILVEPQTPGALAAALHRVIQSDEPYGISAARTVRRYSIGKIIPEFERYYEWVLQKSAS